MSSGIESCIVFTLMVALFAWIYARNRQPRVLLWLLGWIAVLLHLVGFPLQDASLMTAAQAIWMGTALQLVAGSFFLLSVSGPFATPRKSSGFLFAISIAFMV